MADDAAQDAPAAAAEEEAPAAGAAEEAPAAAAAEEEAPAAEEAEAAPAEEAPAAAAAEEAAPPPPPEAQETTAADGATPGPAVAVADPSNETIPINASTWEESSFEPRIALMPRYALPNITSMLPEYSNAEQDTIHRAFLNNNCVESIARLPNEIYTHEVNRARARVREDVRTRISPHAVRLDEGEKSCGKAVNGKGVFQEFAYTEDPYSRKREFQTAERLAKEAQRLSVHPETKGTMVPPGNVKKLPHQEGFEEDANYPYSMDPYEHYQDDALRNKWMEEAKVLYGAFVPSGTDKPFGDRPTKAMAREVIDAVASVIAADWEGVDFDVHANDEEQWVIRFRTETVDSEAGLLTYMNLMMRCNDMVLKHGLRKVIDAWNVRAGEHLHFTVAPPWSERNATGKAWYALHPEESKYSGQSWMAFTEDSTLRAGAAASAGDRRRL